MIFEIYIMSEETTIIHFLLENLTSIWDYLLQIIIILPYYLQVLAILLFIWKTYHFLRERDYRIHSEKQAFFLTTWLFGWGVDWLFPAFHLSL